MQNFGEWLKNRLVNENQASFKEHFKVKFYTHNDSFDAEIHLIREVPFSPVFGSSNDGKVYALLGTSEGGLNQPGYEGMSRRNVYVYIDTKHDPFKIYGSHQDTSNKQDYVPLHVDREGANVLASKLTDVKIKDVYPPEPGESWDDYEIKPANFPVI